MEVRFEYRSGINACLFFGGEKKSHSNKLRYYITKICVSFFFFPFR